MLAEICVLPPVNQTVVTPRQSNVIITKQHDEGARRRRPFAERAPRSASDPPASSLDSVQPVIWKASPRLLAAGTS
jgi:hypothetical protein